MFGNEIFVFGKKKIFGSDAKGIEKLVNGRKSRFKESLVKNLVKKMCDRDLKHVKGEVLQGRESNV